MRRRTWILATARSALLWAGACAISACLFGGGTEDPNDFKLSGTALREDGSPAAEALLFLYQDSLPDGFPGDPDTVVADPQGRFAFSGLKVGWYAVVALDTASGTIALTTKIQWTGRKSAAARDGRNRWPGLPRWLRCSSPVWRCIMRS